MAETPTIDTSYYPANWSTNRAGAPIVAIVAHNTVGRDSRAYLKRGGDAADGSDRKVSAHVLIRKDGVIYRYLDDTRGANHAGFGTMPPGFVQVNPNRCTLSFELENRSDGKSVHDPYPDAQLLAMGWQINEWRRLHGSLPVLLHRVLDPSRRADPVGLSVQTIEVWCERAAEQYGTDLFAGWGNIGKPGKDQEGWAIPRAWLVNKRLGKCVRAEAYLAPTLSVAVFESGFIYYVVRTKSAHVVLF